MDAVYIGQQNRKNLYTIAGAHSNTYNAPHKNLYIYLLLRSICINNIWSYFPWSPVIVTHSNTVYCSNHHPGWAETQTPGIPMRTKHMVTTATMFPWRQTMLSDSQWYPTFTPCFSSAIEHPLSLSLWLAASFLLTCLLSGNVPQHEVRAWPAPFRCARYDGSPRIEGFQLALTNVLFRFGFFSLRV